MTRVRSIRLCLALSAALILIAAAGGAAYAGGQHVWLTTGDRAHLLARQPDGALGPPAADAPTIAVDRTRGYQRIEGLGASITDSSAHLLARSPHRDAIMRQLFDPRRGLGLSYLRQPMGASDFVAGAHYTYDDVPAGPDRLRPAPLLDRA
jgi:glucosylceramidase